jgi:hypothetical protein
MLLILSAAANAQIKKIYGYTQELQGGAMQGRNNIRNQSGVSNYSRYFLFAEIKKNKPVTFKQVWIKESLYTFKTDTIKKSPVILESSNGGEMILRDTLIRSSKEQIIQLKDLVKSAPAPVSLTVKKLIAANDVVIVFICKGVSTNFILKKLKTVHPLMTQ